MKVHVFLIVLGAALTIPVCWAQIPTAQITGQVTDSTGAVVPGAEIEITSLETGASWRAISGPSGYYTIASLPTGNYRIHVQLTGFKSIERTGVKLDVGKVARFDFGLEVGQLAETVEVTGAAPLLESETAALGQVVEERVINDLPLNGRNYLQLARLGPGVVEPRQGDNGAEGGSFTANGVRAALNNYNLDGADNNTRIVDIQNQSHQVIQPSVDAIQEFKIETANYSAEYGYSAGAVVNATLKSGSNDFHGRAFYFGRNDAFDARDFFQAPDSEKTLLQRHQYGGTFGGPVVREKAFFFASWERTSENRGLAFTRTVPTMPLRQGDFSGFDPIFDVESTRANPNGSGFIRDPFPGNQFPASRISEVSSNVLALLPPPTQAGSANNFLSSPTWTDRFHRVDSRGDIELSEKDRAFVRFSFSRRGNERPGALDPPLIGGTGNGQHFKTTNAWSVAVGETHTIGAAAVNEFRFGFSRVFDNRGDLSDSEEFLGPQFGFKGIPANPGNGVFGLPNMNILGFLQLGHAGFVPNGKVARVLQFKDDVAWVRGPHYIKVGAQYQWVPSFFDLGAQARGTFAFNGSFTQDPQRRATTGNAFADFLDGTPNNSTLSRTTVGEVVQNYVSLFLQDDWKVSRRLTLNLGLRWEVWTPRVEREDRQANFLPGLNRLIFPNDNWPSALPPETIAAIPDGIGRRSLVKTDWNNFAPRLGFAYRLSNTTVVRSGAGLFFMSPAFPGVGATPPGNPPFLLTSQFPTDRITPLVTFDSGFPDDALEIDSINPSSVIFRAFDPDFFNGYVAKWSFGLQQELGAWLFEANYVGTSGSHIPLFYDINSPAAGPGAVQARRPFQPFGSISYDTPAAFSRYHALETRVERRFASGLQLLLAYTHSKAIDVGGEQLGGGDTLYRDVTNIYLERSLALYDMRDRFVASFLYDIPFRRGGRELPSPFLRAVLNDWQINGIVTLRSGQPFTPALGVSTANTGHARPSRSGDGNLPGDLRTVENFFDKTAFFAASGFEFGNAGRNILIGPGGSSFDFSVFRRFPAPLLGDVGEIQFRAEFFNLTNTPQFGQPNARVDLPQGASITSLQTPMREIQFGLKILF